AGRPALTFFSAVRIGVPVAAVQCIGLISANTVRTAMKPGWAASSAVMYISVSFCQMIKAWTPATVYLVGCLVGTQKWSAPCAKTLAVITAGLMITSAGELEFGWYGFLMQCTALFSEGLRINLLELLLSSSGYKLNPLSSVMVFAPFASLILLMIGLATDANAVSLDVIHDIGEPALAANALIAFLLNIASYVAIQLSSGLVYALAGIVKDISIIVGAVILMGSSMSAMQMLGYAVALVGIQAYGVVSKAPAKFESGVLYGLAEHLKGTPRPPPILDLECNDMDGIGNCILQCEEGSPELDFDQIDPKCPGIVCTKGKLPRCPVDWEPKGAIRHVSSRQRP
ncbi:unnamed protein product, partial [Effrenium voratum]